MPYLNHDDDALRRVLQESRAIAVVGYSNKPDRASYQVAQYLQQVGYTVIPVNPAVERIGPLISYPSLSAVPVPVDIVNVFRRSDYLPEIVEDAIALGLPTVWAQLGVSNDEALQIALDADLNVIMDKCIKVDHHRLISSA